MEYLIPLEHADADADADINVGSQAQDQAERVGQEPRAEGGTGEEGLWDWTEEAESGPATTWPLGEILMARHDLQHSRIFNS